MQSLELLRYKNYNTDAGKKKLKKAGKQRIVKIKENLRKEKICGPKTDGKADKI